MRVLLVDNAHIYKTPDGAFYTPSIYGNLFFKRYLDVFHEVHFLAKTKHVDRIQADEYIRIDINGLKIIELPWYRGLRSMLLVLARLLRVYRAAGDDCECVIYRVCQIESYFAYLLRRRKAPFFLEVVNDPETFTDLPLIFRHLNTLMLKVMLRSSGGASFVTERILQEKYLPRRRLGKKVFIQSSYSSVELPEDCFGEAKKFTAPIHEIKLVHVANSISNDVKGHITLLMAVKFLIEKGYRVRVKIVGDGDFVDALRVLTRDTLGIEGSVEFVGRIHSRPALFECLAASDMYVYPTRLEGLPRSLIEAMAAGLPCLSTPIAGIPELLDGRYLFAPDDHFAFAKMIAFLMTNFSELEEMSRRNLSVARRYEASKLSARRQEFYRNIAKLAAGDVDLDGMRGK